LWQNQPGAIPSRPGRTLHAACALYLKDHSYGEYVFDHAWANAYHQHRLAYYPKALIAPPFTPVPGARLLARDGAARVALLQALIGWCEQQDLSSLHILFASELDAVACAASGMLLRHSVQFHWTNRAPAMGGAYRDFDDFLAGLAQDKRKKIRQERRKVVEAGVHFRWAQGVNISATDWDFFYRCYERTYYEHGNAPYLSRAFFRSMARDMPENWLLFVAERVLDRLQPVLLGWKSVDDGDTYLPYHFDLRRDAAKLEPGTQMHLGIRALGASLDLLLEIGPRAIEARVLELTDLLAEGLRGLGAGIVSPRDGGAASSILTFVLGDTDALHAALTAAGVVCRRRLGGVRLAPHFYNDADDVARVLAAVRAHRG